MLEQPKYGRSQIKHNRDLGSSKTAARMERCKGIGIEPTAMRLRARMRGVLKNKRGENERKPIILLMREGTDN